MHSKQLASSFGKENTKAQSNPMLFSSNLASITPLSGQFLLQLLNAASITTGRCGNILSESFVGSPKCVNCLLIR